MSARLILASTSPYRRELLDRLGVPYEAVPHHCDEGPVMAAGGPPEAGAGALARAKAESLREACPGAWILGSDQVAEVDGAILGKPGTPEKARAQLARLAGRAHRLVTAVCLLGPEGQRSEHVDVHGMHLRALSEAEVARYVAREAPLDCCGSYKIERLGIALFERIEGRDFTAITGLPLMAVSAMLRDAGFDVP
ncbi:MAG: septum formation protein Maf [Sandaracinus sp.]|nr:septum formation protein Maf [Sandaracinus sp.]